MRKGTKLELEEAEKQRRSELAKNMNQEVVVDPKTGIERRKFGGAQPGSGRPRKKRFAEFIAEQLEEHHQDLLDRLLTIAKEGNDGNARAAINDLLKIEEQERKIHEGDERRFDDMKRDEVMIYLAEKLAEAERRNGRLDSSILGSAVELEDLGNDRAGEDDEDQREVSSGSRSSD